MMVQMGGQIKTPIIPRGAKMILLVLSWGLIFAQSDSLDTSLDRTAENSPSPHTEDVECSLCHVGLYDREKSVDQNLCHRCHQQLEYRTKRYKHSMEKGCLACHQNHRPRGQPLLRADPIDVCTGCHDLVVSNRTHPMRVIDPNTKGELTCTSSCHDVHGTDFKFLCRLEPGRQLCISCHNDLK
jgi:predicted CXXCH cytochrome family protein